MHKFVANLLQIRACIQANDDAIIPDAAALVDHITEGEMANAIPATGETKFAQAAEQQWAIRFVNLVIEPETVHSLKTILCLLTSSHSAIPPVLLLLRENMNLNADDSTGLFAYLFSLLDAPPIVICAVIIDNLCAQGLDRILYQSPILHVKWLDT
jgi:hypothetical protein